jgi:hypothetical protein
MSMRLFPLCALGLAAGCAAGGMSREDGRQPRDAHRERSLIDQMTQDLAPRDFKLPPDTPRDFKLPPDKRPSDLKPSPDKRPPDFKLSPDKRPPDLKPPPDKKSPDTKPTGPQTLLFLDFEANNGNLIATRDWQWGVLSFKAGASCDGTPVPPTACHSGTRCWGTVLNDCYSPLGNADASCAATAPSSASVLSLTVQIPASYKNARLIYWEWNDYFTPFDWAEVRVNGTPLLQQCPSSYTAPTVWVKQTILLNSYLGKSVTIAFHFYATSVVQYSGWYIDDLSIGEY